MATNSGTLLQTVQYPSFVLENVVRDNQNVMVVAGGKTIVGGEQQVVGHYVYGNTYGANPTYQTDNTPATDRRPPRLLVHGKYPILSPNQHTDKTAADVINLKDSVQNGGGKSSSHGRANCAAALLGLHLSASSSAYINNVWVWVADHSIDGAPVGTDIAAKGGVLVEATAGTWLTGVGSENSWSYSLGYNQASNVLISLFQSETNYRQGGDQDGSGPPSDPPPGPFNAMTAEPSWEHCDGAAEVCRMTMNQWFRGGSDIVSYASASWNFGDAANDKQANVNVVEQAPGNLQLYGLCAGPNTDYIMRLPNGSRFGRREDGYGGSWQTLDAETIL